MYSQFVSRGQATRDDIKNSGNDMEQLISNPKNVWDTEKAKTHEPY